jgi:phosphoadenosine phosphosulfate reductase
MTPDQITHWNAELRDRSPLEITRWAIRRAGGRAVVSTNFRPYEAVVLHLCATALPDIPVLWVDHGYNRPSTYRHAEQLRKLLNLNLKTYLPKISAAHRDALYGPVPTPEDEAALKQFSAVMKLEPFRRGMRELGPKVWLTALRKIQNPNRAGLDIVSSDTNFGALKVSPVFYLTDGDMEAYLEEHHLPNEWDYFDPAKADDKRECGLHAAWGLEALNGNSHVDVGQTSLSAGEGGFPAARRSTGLESPVNRQAGKPGPRQNDKC